MFLMYYFKRKVSLYIKQQQSQPECGYTPHVEIEIKLSSQKCVNNVGTNIGAVLVCLIFVTNSNTCKYRYKEILNK